MKFLKRCIFLTVIIASLVFPASVEAFSFQQTLSPVSLFLTTIGEKIQYVFAFTPTSKVGVLGNQAQKRLVTAQNDADKAASSIQEYQKLKNQQNTFLDKVDEDTLNQVREQTQEEQQILTRIGNNQPGVVDVIMNVNSNVVGEIKKTITLKEGTTAGEAFEQKAIITYAPGTSGQGTATHTYEGGALQIFAPGTSGGGSGGADIKTVEVKTGGVVEEGLPPGVTRGEGGTAVDSLAPGTTNSSEGSGNNDTWVINP